MVKHARWIGTGAAVVFLGIAYWTFCDRGEAADAAALKTGLPKLADAIAKKDAATVKTLVESLSKDTNKDDLMVLFNARSDKKNPGLGVGPTPGTITPDGIEIKIKEMSTKPYSTFTLPKHVDALIQMSYQAAAGGKLSKAIADGAVPREIGKRKKADWIKWSDDTDVAAMELAAALETAKKAPKVTPAITKNIQAAALKLDNACVACHNVFKTN